MKFKVIGSICLVLAVFIYSCQSEADLEFSRYYSAGSVIYQGKCQNCHGVNGQGLSALIPPLNDSVYLKTNKDSLACFVKNGVKGKLTLAQKTFEGEMPANDLAPIEIAEVLTYVTNSFGNKMGTITSGQVGGYLNHCK